MEIIPAIDLLDGRCVRLYQGDYAQSQVFAENPVEMARSWVEQGATRLHLVDLDGAKTGKLHNLKAIEAITLAVSVPIQVGGGLRSRDTVASLLSIGVKQTILGTIAVEQPDLVAQLCQEFPGQIVIGIDARDGKVAIQGWLETSPVLAIDLAKQMAQLGVARIIYTDIYRDGTLTGPNLTALREIATSVDIPIIASGGVSSVTDLLNLLTLEPLGVTGVIIGSALYTKKILLKEAIQAVGSGRIQDIPLDFGNSTFA